MFSNAFGPPEIDPGEIEQYNVLGDGTSFDFVPN
jgi:hypothetical protein